MEMRATHPRKQTRQVQNQCSSQRQAGKQLFLRVIDVLALVWLALRVAPAGRGTIGQMLGA
jgi:hypothetical protein